MCTSTFDAIHQLIEKLRPEGKAETLAVVLPHVKIVGKPACGNGEHCFENVISLKDAKVICFQTGHKKDIRWINVSCSHILAFTFSSCEPGCECGCQ